jgi:beta-glucosidase
VRAGEPVVCEIDVANTSAREGIEVVQLYAHDVDASVRRPLRELVAFEKVTLAAGETRTVRFSIGPRALSYWDVSAKDWKLEPGGFELHAGRSSRDLRASARVEIEAPE